MKKINLVLLLVLIPFHVFTQHSLNKEIIREFFFPVFQTDIFQKITPTTQHQDLVLKLCLLANHCDFCYSNSTPKINELNEYLLEHAKSTYLIDLDEDGDLDIVFDGVACSGFERGIVEFYENQKDTLIRHFKIAGTLVNLNLYEKEFSIYNYPCCAEQTHYIIDYRFNP